MIVRVIQQVEAGNNNYAVIVEPDLTGTSEVCDCGSTMDQRQDLVFYTSPCLPRHLDARYQCLMAAQVVSQHLACPRGKVLARGECPLNGAEVPSAEPRAASGELDGGPHSLSLQSIAMSFVLLPVSIASFYNNVSTVTERMAGSGVSLS